MDNTRYTIGWIAPLALELAAALAMTDDNYEEITVGDHKYHGGTIGKHYVVMAVQSRTGTTAASGLAAWMCAAFRNLKCFLVVGIGGGVRSYGPYGAASQIVLGDVVVSVPKGNFGGVVQYDVGAWTGDGHLETSGHTNSPPAFLLDIVNSLTAKHRRSASKIPVFLKEMRSRLNANEQHKFEDQGAENDRLFDDDYDHPEIDRGRNCVDVCDRKKSTSRKDRGDGALRLVDTPNIHYGNIGSSNQLQISATKRTKCQNEHQIICFEMEGAGVIQTHPCLVIRGICDYSDSHKNKKWQSYAAATAAAYAKELLGELPACRYTKSSAVADERREHDSQVFSGSISTTGGKAFLGNTFYSNGGNMTF